MGKHKAPSATGGAGPKGDAERARRSGQGSASALREMLRRQLQNPNQPQHHGTAVTGDEPTRPTKRQNRNSR